MTAQLPLLQLALLELSTVGVCIWTAPSNKIFTYGSTFPQPQQSSSFKYALLAHTVIFP